MFNSIVQERGITNFPKFNNEKVYMLPFTKQKGLPKNLSHWQPTVDSMLENVDTKETLYLMIDQKEVKANTFHRRSGLHIDGYWIPNLNRHGGHKFTLGKHTHSFLNCTFEKEESLLLASNIQACRAFEGPWQGVIGEGGDCSHIDVSDLKEIIMQPNKVYAGNVTMLHESLEIPFDCLRTVVRLNVPDWNPLH